MDRKTAIVTGGSGDIGGMIVRTLAAAGYRLLIGYHKNEEKALALQKEINDQGGESFIYRHDLSCPTDADLLVQEAVKRFGGLDLLVNNAGSALRKLASEMTDGEWEEMIRLNLSSVFFLARAAIPVFLQKRAGVIINISSIDGIAGASYESAYSAAKAGVIGLTKALAKELAPNGIRVNCVAPGAIDTKMIDFLTLEERALLREEIPLGRLGTAEEVASVVLFLAENNYMTGQIVSPNGGICM